MATVKAVTRPKKDKEGQRTIYIRITQGTKVRYVSTGLKVKPRYWNEEKGKVRSSDYYDEDSMNKIIQDKIKAVTDEIYRRKATDQDINPDALKKVITTKSDPSSDFIKYAEKFADRKRQTNIQTGRRYDAIVYKLQEYTGGKLPFKDLSVSWLKEYSDWLAKERENKPNTIHSNMRAIRAILYDAIREGIFPQEKNPFFKMTLKQPKVSRTKLNPGEIKALMRIDEFYDKMEELARDAFLFSFFTCGMRFRDVALLKWKQKEQNHIRYKMNKTGNSQSVKLVPQAIAIMNKYIKSATPDSFVFPLIDSTKNIDDPKIRDQDISSKNAYVNKRLKTLAGKAEINKSISFHVARHSYADIARKKGVDLHSISKSLGHQGLKTTEKYLKGLDNQTTDQAVENLFKDF